MKTLTLLSKIALSFQHFDHFDWEMNDILKDIGNFIDVSRIYIFLNESKDVVNNVFEWCGEGVTPQINNLQKINYQDIPSWIDLLSKKGSISSSDILTLPQDIIDGLKPQGIKSIIVYPLLIGKKIEGFIGFDECRYNRTWKKEELELLETISGIIANAYERKNIQQELLESKNNFHTFFETMTDMLIVSTFKGQIIHCNQTLINKLGYSLAELKEMTILDLHPEDLREEASIIVEKMLKGQTDYCSLEVCGKFGQTYSVETRIQFGKWNKEDCLFTISKDISKEKETVKLFSNVFENNPLAMAINRLSDGKFTKVNDTFLKKTGYRKDELLGKTTWDLELFAEPEKINKFCTRVVGGEKIKDEEILVKCQNGQLLNALVSIEIMNNLGEKSFLTAIVDVTEKAILAKKIADQYQKLENIIEGSNLGTWEWNAQTDEIIINEQWAKLLGYSLAELQPACIDTWSKLTHPKDLEIANRLLAEHLNGNSDYYACEIRMKHKDGHWVWIQDSGKVVETDSDGRPVKLFGTHADISRKKQAEEALKESEKRFFLALDEAKAGLWDFDIINQEVFLSPMWKQILGYEDHEIENSVEAWQDLWHPDDSDKIKKLTDDYLKGKSKTYEAVNRLKHKDGSYRWILSRGGILKDENGTPIRWIGTNIDITKEHEQALELERFFSVNLDLLCITDMKGNFVKTNKAWEDILGYSSEELKKRNFLDFIHPDDLSATLEAMKQLKSGQKVIHFVNRYISASNDYRHIEWRSNPYGDLIYAAARDITRRIEYEKEILDVSNRDPLTNIYNRRCIYSRTEEIIEEYKRTGKIFSVCIIDIDHFKKVNDTYGHQIGDSVLKNFTKIIGENLRPYDLLGRYGGEEFILVLNHTSKTQSFLIVERILNTIRNQPFVFANTKIKLTFSAGISNCREIKKEKLMVYDLVEMADRRMYKAKQSGRNKIIFSDSFNLANSNL